jgi:uncharacterized protein
VKFAHERSWAIHRKQIQGGPVLLKRLIALVLSAAALCSTGAWASDIQCATTRQPAERVICDHAILNNEYDDIVAQQQALFSAGKLSSGQLAQWRQLRNGCTDVHCIDGVFAQWKTMARSVENVAQAPTEVASSTEMAPGGPNPNGDPLPASQAVPTSGASLVRQGSAAGVALPQPVVSEASAPTVASAAVGEKGSRSMPGISGLLVFVLVVVIGLGAFLMRRRNRGGEKKSKS